METKLLAEQIKSIEIPDEMKERILKNCYRKMEENTLRKNKNHRTWKRPAAVAASFILCLCLTGLTGLAASGKLRGVFKDITNWNGAVTGTSYEQATDEIEVHLNLNADQLAVNIRFLLPLEAPYAYIETLGIEHYEIRDISSNVLMEGTVDMQELNSDTITFTLPAEDLETGTYTLYINQFLGGAKADQPLPINGNWECEFVKS